MKPVVVEYAVQLFFEVIVF